MFSYPNMIFKKITSHLETIWSCMSSSLKAEKQLFKVYCDVLETFRCESVNIQCNARQVYLCSTIQPKAAQSALTGVQLNVKYIKNKQKTSKKKKKIAFTQM